MIVPYHLMPVGHRPRHLDVAAPGRGRFGDALEPRLVPRPHTYQRATSRAKHPLDFDERRDPVLVGGQMMQDRDADSRIERIAVERQLRRLAFGPRDALRARRWPRLVSPDHEKVSREIE